MDILDPQARSDLMSKIRSKNTKPEIVVRSYLHARGLRYRLHDRRLPGRPDLVFPRWRVAAFVNGCFWHGHEGCKKATIPKTRADFWRSKIAANRERDSRNRAMLETRHWRVVIVWECEICPDRLERLYREILGLGREMRGAP